MHACSATRQLINASPSWVPCPSPPGAPFDDAFTRRLAWACSTGIHRIVRQGALVLCLINPTTIVQREPQASACAELRAGFKPAAQMAAKLVKHGPSALIADRSPHPAGPVPAVIRPQGTAPPRRDAPCRVGPESRGHPEKPADLSVELQIKQCFACVRTGDWVRYGRLKCILIGGGSRCGLTS